MKKQLRYLLLGGCLLGSNAWAQAPFTISVDLDVNNFRARHMVHGDMWYNATTSTAACEYPKGSGKHASFAGSIWMSGIDGAGQLHTAASLYGAGNDYWPGPLDASGSLSYAVSAEWARFWKINRKDILDYLALSTPTLSTIPDVVLQWPARGNVNVRGASGMGLVIDRPMAPFVDADGDGLYDPLKGDYPDMKGDQMIWWVFSDNGPVHDMSKGRPFKVEYHAMAYAYNRGGVEADMMFYEYTMFNRSADKYDQFRFGLFSDADLGCPFDDYVAFDREHRMGIEYNSEPTDCPNGTNAYGKDAPMTGLTFLEMPGDHYPDMLPAGSFNTTYSSATGRPPAIDTEFHHFLHAKDIYGHPMPDTFMYELAPGKGECELKNSPGDRRYVITTNDYAFQPGTVAKIAMAFIATEVKEGYSCPVSNFKDITDRADSAWKIYRNPPPPLSQQEIELQQQMLKIYPNPASGMLYAELTGIGAMPQLQVYDVTGRRLQLTFVRNNNTISADISALAPGVYSLVYDDGTKRQAQTFVKR